MSHNNRLRLPLLDPAIALAGIRGPGGLVDQIEPGSSLLLVYDYADRELVAGWLESAAEAARHPIRGDTGP